MNKLTSEGKCKKKTPYANKAMANKAMKLLKSSKTLLGDTHNLKPYQCNVCGKWHIGHRYTDVETIFKQWENNK